MKTIEQIIEIIGVVGFILAAFIALTTLRAIVKYSIEFIGHSLKRPRFFLASEPPLNSEMYYCKTRSGVYDVLFYDSHGRTWHSSDYSEIEVFLWSYLPTTTAEWAPHKPSHDEVLEKAISKSEVGTYSERIEKLKDNGVTITTDSSQTATGDIKDLVDAEEKVGCHDYLKGPHSIVGSCSAHEELGKSSRSAKTGNYECDLCKDTGFKKVREEGKKTIIKRCDCSK